MERFELAKQLAQEAGEIVLQYAKKGFTVGEKDGGSLVTEADLAAEKHILAKIREHFPDDGIVAEETGAQKGKNEFSWHVDPIDGTTNFAHGIPLYGVSVAVVENTQPVAGAIYLPPQGEFYAAARKKGAMMNGKTIHVSEPSDATAAIVGLASPRFVEMVAEGDFLLQNFITGVRRVRILGSIVATAALVSCGALDAGVFVKQNSWDAAAGALLVQEAGGRVIDFSGNQWATTSDNLIVGNVAAVSLLQRIASR